MKKTVTTEFYSGDPIKMKLTHWSENGKYLMEFDAQPMGNLPVSSSDLIKLCRFIERAINDMEGPKEMPAQ